MWRYRLLVLACVPFLIAVSFPKGELRRLPPGSEADDSAIDPDISDDGRFIVFQSRARNLVPDGSDQFNDVFLYDREKNKTTQISRTFDGSDPAGSNLRPEISANGRYIVYASTDDEIVEEENNGTTDVYLFDRKTKTTERVSLASDGEPVGGFGSDFADVSSNGRFIVFRSRSKLVPDDDNNVDDIYLRDRKKGTTTRISVGASGEQLDVASGNPVIADGGRYILFETTAAILDSDVNTVVDVYRYDRATETIAHVSAKNSAGADMGGGGHIDISRDGRFATFSALSNNLVPGVTGIQVYRRDMKTGKVKLVSQSTKGVPGEVSTAHSLSSDGRWVAFKTVAKLAKKDQNDVTDIYLRDMKKNGKTTLLSIGNGGLQADDDSGFAAVSKKGKIVVFESLAGSLVPESDAGIDTDLFVYRK